jgi:hypothetical protein
VSLIDTARLREIAEVEFSDIVVEAFIPDTNELRIILIDGSYVDVWFSLKLRSRYSYHWERRAIDGRIFRHDNAPHQRWQSIATYPKHFHDGSEANATESHISEVPDEALRDFLSFVRAGLRSAMTGI